MSIFKNKNAKTIMVVGLAILAVATVWVIKNTLEDEEVQGDGNPDFALNVTKMLDLDQLKTYGVPIIIDFGSDSCQPCREMAPIIEELNAELQGKAIIRYVDVWNNQELAEGFPISVIPTQLFIDSAGNPHVPKDTASIPMKMYESQDTEDHIFTTHEGGLTKSQMLAILNEMGME